MHGDPLNINLKREVDDAFLDVAHSDVPTNSNTNNNNNDDNNNNSPPAKLLRTSSPEHIIILDSDSEDEEDDDYIHKPTPNNSLDSPPPQTVEIQDESHIQPYPPDLPAPSVDVPLLPFHSSANLYYLVSNNTTCNNFDAEIFDMQFTAIGGEFPNALVINNFINKRKHIKARKQQQRI